MSKPRRSRMEMLLDVLDVVSEGAKKPTRIMQVANLQWTDLLTLVEELTRKGLMTREADTREYALTAKGTSVLDTYSSLKEVLGASDYQPAPTDSMERMLRHPILIGKNKDVVSSLEARLKRLGFKMLPNVIKGGAGVPHNFDVVARDKDGTKRCYVVLGDVSESQVVELFVRQFDTEMAVAGIYTGKIPHGARSLASSYGIRMEKWEEEKESADGGPRRAFAALDGKLVLLEVDPVARYEDALREVATEFIAAGKSASVFTWKASPVHGAFSGMEGVRLFTMTSTVSYTKRVEGAEEFLVPQDDRAVLLDEMRKLVESDPRPRGLIILDSISDMLVLSGLEDTYDFVRKMNELFEGAGITVVSLVKLGTLEPRTGNLIKGLFANHLMFGPGGLSTTR